MSRKTTTYRARKAHLRAPASFSRSWPVCPCRATSPRTPYPSLLYSLTLSLSLLRSFPRPPQPSPLSFSSSSTLFYTLPDSPLLDCSRSGGISRHLLPLLSPSPRCPPAGASLSPTTSTNDPVTPPTHPIPSMHRRESITAEREPGTDPSTLDTSAQRQTPIWPPQSTKFNAEPARARPSPAPSRIM